MKKSYGVLILIVSLLFFISTPIYATNNDSIVVITRVTHINLLTQTGVVGVPFQLEAEVFPGNASFIASDIVWSLISTQMFPAAGSPTVSASGLVSAISEGYVGVRATIPNGAGEGVDFVADFTIVFTSAGIQVDTHGLSNLFVNQVVNGRISFVVHHGTFVSDIYPADFFVLGLPPGLFAGQAERVSDTEVSIPITGAPLFPSTATWQLHVPNIIAPRNVRLANLPINVTRGNLTVGPVAESALVFWDTIFFDLNPLSESHMDGFVILDDRDIDLRRIMFGRVELEEGEDYSRSLVNTFVIYTSFLSRVAVGEWDLRFDMRVGADPIVRLVIFDSRLRPDLVLPDLPTVPLAPPVPPLPPHHPDESFIFLSGGIAVDLFDLDFTIQPRINPRMVNNRGVVTLGVELFYHWDDRLPDTSIEIITPMARIIMPSDLMHRIHGGWYNVFQTELLPEDVSLRVVITNVLNEAPNEAFDAFFPFGEILSPIIDLQFELVDDYQNVLFSARELSDPIDITFTSVNHHASFMRPAGLRFFEDTLEYVPQQTLPGNLIRISTIFPGMYGVVHTGAYFNDVTNGNPNFETARQAAYTSLIHAHGSLNPYAPVTRSEFLQLLALSMQFSRAEGFANELLQGMEAHPNFDGLYRTINARVLDIRSGLLLGEDDLITLEEMTALAGRVIYLNDLDFLSDEDSVPEDFILNESFTPYIEYAFTNGVMDGLSEEDLVSDLGNRMQAIVIITNLARLLGLLN